MCQDGIFSYAMTAAYCVLSGALFIIIQSCFAEWFVADGVDNWTKNMQTDGSNSCWSIHV